MKLMMNSRSAPNTLQFLRIVQFRGQVSWKQPSFPTHEYNLDFVHSAKTVAVSGLQNPFYKNKLFAKVGIVL